MTSMRSTLKYFCFSILTFAAIPQVLGASRISVLDVGYGSCVLLQTEDQNFLFDTGPEETAKKVMRFLSSRNVVWIDAIFISHDHPDHVGSLQQIVQNMPTNTIFWPNHFELPSYLQKFRDDPFYPTRVVLFGPGAGIKLGKRSSIQFLSQSASYNNPNDNSIVFGITCNKQNLLISSDVGPSRRKDLLQNEFKFLRKTNWFLWPHHGEKIEPEFQSAFKMKPICVVSVGENPFGLPSPSLKEDADGFCGALYRTDAMSDLDFMIDRSITLEATESLR